MDRMILTLKHPLIWLRRFRYRCGYGVHSPFAFDFITNVVYERTQYYKYKELEEEKSGTEDGRTAYEPMRVKRLLLRLANFAHPDTVVDVGTAVDSSRYLKAGRKATNYNRANNLQEMFLEAGVPVDMLYVHDWHRPDFVREVFEVCVERTTPSSMFVIAGIGYTPQMRALWKQVRQDGRTGITFDLYDLGIIFFDKKKNKQNYIVNF